MSEYVVSTEKQQLFDVLLDLLIEFSRVCTEHGIKYYASGGTMLGAVRHKGFIPWDDDVDIIMPRKDYNKLKKIAADGAFKKPFFFQNPSTDKGYPKGFSRLRNSFTTEIPFDDVAMNCNRGIFIDIFPLDVIPDSEKKQKKQIKKLQTIRLFMNSFARYYSGFGIEGTTKIKSIAYYCILPLFKCRILTSEKLFKLFERVASKYDNTINRRVCAVTWLNINERLIFDKRLWEGKTILCDFENIKVPIPEHFDAILRQMYGEYMMPIKIPTDHGELCFSTTVPYEKYVKDHFVELKDAWYNQTEEGKKHRLN